MIVYQTEAHGNTPARVAGEFAARYWDQPREIEYLRFENNRTLFGVVNGTRTYAVIYCPAVPYVSAALYQVIVLEGV